MRRCIEISNTALLIEPALSSCPVSPNNFFYIYSRKFLDNSDSRNFLENSDCSNPADSYFLCINVFEMFSAYDFKKNKKTLSILGSKKLKKKKILY